MGSKKSEKKTKVTSLRMTEEQYLAIQKMADKKDMSMGSYIVDSAIHSQKSVTPDIMVKIQNLVNTACGAVEKFAPDKAEKMETEAKKVMVIIKVKRDTFGGEKYMKNAVNYVGDGRSVEVRGYGVDPYNTKNTYDQMMAVKKYFGKTGDNPLMHFVISYDKNVTDKENASVMTEQIAESLADKYQLITGIHEENQGGSFYHAHMIMNSVNFHNGKLYNSSPEEIAKLRDRVADVTGRTCRFYF